MDMLFIAFALAFIRSITAADAPIVGILSQETYSVQKCFPTTYDAYIAASYVKFIESGGARVVPIWIGQDRAYYERAVRYTNGMLFPGGATYFDTDEEGYAKAAQHIYDIAEEFNNNGTHYPILGICLGMEVLAFASSAGQHLRIHCDAKRVSLPLEFEADYRTSEIFKTAPEPIVNILKERNVTYNFHQYCLTEHSLKKHHIDDVWRIVSRNKDVNETEFISSMENKKYPFYALQFHPEKSRYEFNKTANILHNLDSNVVSQYFASFFIEQCRKNDHKFPTDSLLYDSLIYNFSPLFSARNCSYFQLYMFTRDDFKKVQLE